MTQENQNPDRQSRNTIPNGISRKKTPSKSPTTKMCRFMHTLGPECSGSYSWKLKSGDQVFVVCDSHLAAGLRAAGLPALISPNPTDTVADARVHGTEALDHNSDSWNKFDEAKTSPGVYIKKRVKEETVYNVCKCGRRLKGKSSCR